MAGPHPLVMLVSGEPWFCLGAADTIPLKLINRNSGGSWRDYDKHLTKLTLFQIVSAFKNQCLHYLIPHAFLSCLCHVLKLPVCLSSHFPLLVTLTKWLTPFLVLHWLTAPKPGLAFCASPWGNHRVFSEYSWGYRHLLLCGCQVVSGGCSDLETASSKENMHCSYYFIQKGKYSFFFYTAYKSMFYVKAIDVCVYSSAP